jgi:hypothetical protein
MENKETEALIKGAFGLIQIGFGIWLLTIGIQLM